MILEDILDVSTSTKLKEYMIYLYDVLLNIYTKINFIFLILFRLLTNLKIVDLHMTLVKIL